MVASDGRLFSSAMRPLKGYPCSSRWSYTCVHTDSTKYTQCVLKKGHEVGGKGGEGDGEEGEPSDLNKICYMNI